MKIGHIGYDRIMRKYFFCILILTMAFLLTAGTAHAAAPAPAPAATVLAADKKVDPKIAATPDTDETLPLPPYPPQARIAIGKMQTHEVGEEDTLLDIARYYRMGFVEIRAANPRIDPWTPVPGESVIIPSFRLLPRAPQKGIVVNLAQMRLYYFSDPKKEPESFPIGVGREGLQTPTGETSVVRKVAGPTWYPTERMREEKPYLPAAVPAGPSNPLGTHALYLGWPTFLIHGSNKPWAIGRRVSSGCMRLYPEDIARLFKKVPVDTPVTVIDQPLLAGWVGDTFYLEANPSKTQGNDIEIDGATATKKSLDDALKKIIAEAAAGGRPDLAKIDIDWDIVKTVLEERRGYPVQIAAVNPPSPPEKAEAPQRDRDRYN